MKRQYYTPIVSLSLSGTQHVLFTSAVESVGFGGNAGSGTGGDIPGRW